MMVHSSKNYYIRKGSVGCLAKRIIYKGLASHVGGTEGKSHGNDYCIKNLIAACVGSAKLQLGMLLILLSDNAKRAKKVIDEYKPMFATKQEYLDFMDSLSSFGDRIEYDENGKVVKVDIH